MAAGSSLRDEIKNENKKMKDMKFREKAAHIWIYYKIRIIGTILAGITILIFVLSLNANNYKTAFSLIFIDGYINGINEHDDIITKEFTEYLGIDGKKERVVLNNDFSFKNKDVSEDAVFSIQKIFTMAASGDIDGYICEYEELNYFAGDEETFFIDLSTVLTENELQKLSPFLIYYTFKNKDKIPYAIDLSSSPLIPHTGLYMEQPCYGIVTTALNIDNAAQFIRYAFDL